MHIFAFTKNRTKIVPAVKKYIILSIKVACSVLLLYLVLDTIELKVLMETFRQGRLLPLSVGVLVGVVFNLVKFLKWQKLIRADSDEHSYWDSAKSYMIGNALGVVTPMRAGDLGRALYFEPASRPHVVGFTIIDRVLDLIAVILFCVYGAIILVHQGFGLFLAVIGIVCLILLYHPLKIYKISSIIFGKIVLGEKLLKVTESLTLLNKRLLSISLTLSLISFFLIIVQFYFVISAFGEVSFLSACLATPMVTLSSLIPITFMGLGVREGFAVYLFSMLGVNPANAFSAAFLCFVINNVSTGFIGIFYMMTLKNNQKGNGCV